jgi:AraC-like DNA-binding protein
MMVIHDEKLSDSPYIEAVCHGSTVAPGDSVRPAESNWHMVIFRYQGQSQLLFVGPLSASGVVKWGEGGELIWIRFKLGVFMPHLPLKDFVNVETSLPDASSQRFWLKSGAWQFPTYENVDTFVARLVRDEVLVMDPVVEAVLHDKAQYIAPRTVRHHFQQATGLSHKQVTQIERAQRAAHLLKQGVSILDTVYELGYYDQPHMTRALKQWVGYTPAQLYRSNISCHFLQDPTLLSSAGYATMP